MRRGIVQSAQKWKLASANFLCVPLKLENGDSEPLTITGRMV